MTPSAQGTPNHPLLVASPMVSRSFAPSASPIQYSANAFPLGYVFEQHGPPSDAIMSRLENSRGDAPQRTPATRRIVRRSIHGSGGNGGRPALQAIALPPRNHQNSTTNHQVSTVWWDPKSEMSVMELRADGTSLFPDSPTTMQLYGFTDPWQKWRAEAERAC